MSSMKLIFMGTPDFSVPTLAALLDAGHDLLCVYSQPPRPAGRGHRERPSPVHAFAAARDIPVRTPRRLRDADEQAAFAALGADAAIVAAYGLILPQAVLDAPRYGCFNVHASLLPRWRGAAPIQRAIQAGDRETGITIMQMDAGLDTGDMLVTGTIPIGADTTAADLHDRLAAMGGPLMTRVLDQLSTGTLRPTPQPEDGVTYAKKLDKEEGQLDWTRPAVELERAVRAFTPWPGAWFRLGKDRIKIFAAQVVAGSATPGQILDDALTIACGTGALRPLRVQKAGKGATDTASFLRGNPVQPGSRLD